jgi:hypothetical protein
MWEKYSRAAEAAHDNTGHATLHAGYLKLQTHTQNIFLPFLTATVVTRTRSSVTLYSTLPLLLHLTLKYQICCGFEFSIVLGSCTSSVVASNATFSRIRTDEVM